MGHGSIERDKAGGARRGVNGTAIGFLAMTFAIVGLTGEFATFSAPLPLQRALAREGALDAALAAARGPDPATALEALRPRLGDSAEAILPPGGDIAARIAAERVAMRARLQQEESVATTRLRWMIGIVTAMGAAFGAVLLSFGRRAPE